MNSQGNSTKGSNLNPKDRQYLHKDLIINSEKEKSAQGSVFYVKMANQQNREAVLKIYTKEEIKSYCKEIAVFKRIKELK